MKVMHYYTYPENSGGPLSYIKNIVSCEYLKDIEFAECYQMKPFSSLRYNDFKRIVNEIKTFGPDILHIHGVQSEGFIGLLAGKKAKVKTLITVHGIQIDAQDMGSLKKALFKHIIEPITLKKADAVFCVCKAMENRHFIQKHTTNLLPTLYNFIPDKFVDSKSCEVILPVHSDKTVITYVGRVTQEKGMKEFEYCVENDDSDNTQYWVVGDGEYKETMEKNLEKQRLDNKVFFFGNQTDVKPFLKDSDVFLFPTYHENLSIALLEAASQKCCCLVSRVGGNPEVVEDSVSGLTFSAQNPEETLATLKKVINDCELRKKYSLMLYNRITDMFSEKVFAQKLLKIYDDLL